MSKQKKQKLVTPEIFHQAVIGSFTKLNPRYMMKKPISTTNITGFFII